MVENKDVELSVAGRDSSDMTADEKQVNILLRSAIEVRDEVEHFQGLMGKARSERSYGKARQAFVDGFERLANLLKLIDEQLQGKINPIFRMATIRRVFAIRQQAFDMCMIFLFDRIRRIRKRTMTVLKGGYHPLGYAGCLEQGLKTVIDAMECMGKLDNLPSPQQQLIDETRSAVVKLSAIEDKMGLWKKVIGVK